MEQQVHVPPSLPLSLSKISEKTKTKKAQNLKSQDIHQTSHPFEKNWCGYLYLRPSSFGGTEHNFTHVVKMNRCFVKGCREVSWGSGRSEYSHLKEGLHPSHHLKIIFFLGYSLFLSSVCPPAPPFFPPQCQGFHFQLPWRSLCLDVLSVQFAQRWPVVSD